MSLARRPVLTRVTAPAELPVTVAEAKARIVLDHGDDDAVMAGLVAAATDFLDGPRGLLGRCIVTQTWEERFEGFPCYGEPLELAVSPLASLTSVKYFDSDGVEQTLDPAGYEVMDNGDTPIVHAFDGWPATDRRRTFPVTVRTVCGFGAAANAPASLKEAIILHAGALYEGRAVTPLDLAELGYHDLIAAHRRPTL